MTPYRSREEPKVAKVAPQAGLVADMVRQFADVHAFVRELVQNGIDAGATAIDVTVDRSTDGVASVRVTDDGCGMTLDILENALLVLFRSTKDEDTTKIGKYGVGFMSVFAIAPSEVTVDSWRDGYAHRVRLFPDHSYEIEHAAPREEHGTMVTLTKTVPAEEFEAFWQKVAASLHRWCRHAEVPIHITVVDAASSAPPRRARVDTPLEVRAVVSVRKKYEDMEIVVGPLVGSATLPKTGTREDDPAAFVGFYNRGLTLFETTEALSSDLAHVRVKVLGSALRHTLSRDDVRRDHAFHLAIARAGHLCRFDLKERVLREVTAEAEAVAKGAGPARLLALLDLSPLPPIGARSTELRVPLVHEVGGMSVMSPVLVNNLYSEWCGLARKTLLTSETRTELTAALAARGVPVVWGAAAAIGAAIEHASEGALACRRVEEECLLVRELPVKQKLANDDTLCAVLGEALGHAGVERVALGRTPGNTSILGAFVTAPPPGDAEHVVVSEAAFVRHAKWPRRALLVLRAGAEPVDCARRAASPEIAAHLLARYLLLSGPGLSSRASEWLATRALERIR